MLRPRESRDLRLISSHVTVAVSSHPCTAFGANPKRENAPVAAAIWGQADSLMAARHG